MVVNLCFGLFFWVLIGTFCWEIRVKINHMAKRILLSKPQSFKNNLLVVNLVQMLLSFALLSTLKMSKLSIFPGHDYLIICFCFLIMKILQLRIESLFPDTVGLLPILLLISSLSANSAGSILQSSNMLLNWILFFLPFPVTATAFVSSIPAMSEISSMFSLFSVISCASAVFVLISLKMSRSFFFAILLLILALRCRIPDFELRLKSTAPLGVEDKAAPTTKYPFSSFDKENDLTGENWSRNLTISRNITFVRRSMSIEDGNRLPESNASSLEVHDWDWDVRLNINLGGNAFEYCDVNFGIPPKYPEISDVCFEDDRNISDNHEPVIPDAVVNYDNKTGDQDLVKILRPDLKEIVFVKKNCDINNIETNSQEILMNASDIPTPGDDENDVLKEEKLLEYHNSKANLESVSEPPDTSEEVPVDVDDCPEENNMKDEDYIILSSELDNSGQCSVEAADLSESNFLMKNFVQFNQYFHNVFPSFPSFKPFQLKKISLLGFSHLCLSLPGSEISLINLGVADEKGINRSNEKRCDSEGKPGGNMINQFSILVASLKKFVLSLL